MTKLATTLLVLCGLLVSAGCLGTPRSAPTAPDSGAEAAGANDGDAAGGSAN